MHSWLSRRCSESGGFEFDSQFVNCGPGALEVARNCSCGYNCRRLIVRQEWAGGYTQQPDCNTGSAASHVRGTPRFRSGR